MPKPNLNSKAEIKEMQNGWWIDTFFKARENVGI